MAENKKTEGLIYKNHPLRRIDNIIYYGSMADKYIIMLQILDTKKEQDMDVATRVSTSRKPLSAARSSGRMSCSSLSSRSAAWTWAPSGWSGLWPGSKREKGCPA